jgi:hypothetical protein
MSYTTGSITTNMQMARATKTNLIANMDVEFVKVQSKVDTILSTSQEEFNIDGHLDGDTNDIRPQLLHLGPCAVAVISSDYARRIAWVIHTFAERCPDC